MDVKDKFYVLGVDGTPWVLALGGFETEAAARSAINWQRRGQADSRWVICKFSPVGGGRFRAINGAASYKPGCGPYTLTAWAGFLSGFLLPESEVVA